MNDTRQFLEALFGNLDETSYLLVWAHPDRRSYWFRDLDAAAALAVRVGAAQNVYVGVGLSDRARGPRVRGKGDEVYALAGLVADLDVIYAGKDRTNLPATREEALSVLDALPLRPTVALDSGHGVQVWWGFKEPYVYDDADDHERVTALAAGWSVRINEAARARGWHFDSVFDPARVMRIPGTRNHKDEDDVRPVTLLWADGPTYAGPDDFIDHVTPVPRAARGESDDGAPTFTLRADAQAPTKKLIDLLRVNSKFKGAYDRTRADVTDKSQSGWDFAMAWQCLPAGWTHQETVDLLVAHRREGPSERDALNKGVGYYQTTINNVRWGVVKGFDEKRARAAIDVEGTIAKGQEATIAKLAEILKVRITSVKQQFPKADVSQYYVSVDGGEEVLIGDVRAFNDPKRFGEALLQKTRHVLPILTRELWRSAQGLMVAIMTVDNTPSVSREEETEDWTRRYLEAGPATGDRAGATFEHHPFLEDGYIHLQVEQLVTFVHGNGGVQVTRADLQARLREAGWEAIKVWDRHKETRAPYARWYWRRRAE